LSYNIPNLPKAFTDWELPILNSTISEYPFPNKNYTDAGVSVPLPDLLFPLASLAAFPVKGEIACSLI